MGIRGFFSSIVSGGGGGTPTGAQFVGLQNVGTKLNTILSTLFNTTPAVAASPVITAMMPENAAVLTTQLVSGTGQVSVNEAEQLSTVLDATGSTKEVPAGKIVQIKYDLTGTYGAASATNVTVSGSAWASSANAAGLHNGTNATHNGAASAQDAYLNFAWPSFPNKSDADLVISAVSLNFYFQQAGTILNNGGLTLYWGTTTNQAANTIANFTGNQNSSVTPYSVDLFAAGITTWTQLATLGARIRGTLAALSGATQSVDAVELVVTASATQLP